MDTPMSDDTTAIAGEQTTERTAAEVKAFEAITSQDDFDARIQARLDRERKKIPTDYEELKAKAQKFTELEEANKTEAEKREEAFNTTAKERDDARRDAALARAALKHGLSEDDLDLISEGPAEGIESRAEKLAARLGSQKLAGPSSSAIARTNATQKTDDFDTAIADARAARNFPLAISLQQQKSAALAERKD